MTPLFCPVTWWIGCYDKSGSGSTTKNEVDGRPLIDHTSEPTEIPVIRGCLFHQTPVPSQSHNLLSALYIVCTM